MHHILLVNPGTDAGADHYSAVSRIHGHDAVAFIPPLALATLAALTPAGFTVDIWDEAVRGPLTADQDLSRYDMVGVTGYQAHYKAMKRIAATVRVHGVLLIAGGPGVSAAPENYTAHFDVIFIGEAENTWPRFLADWAQGRHQREYRQIVKPDVVDSPPPDWSAVAADMHRYFLGAVQTTRGCPFDCEFCDVIFLYGRRPRHKRVDQVLAEVAALQKLGVKGIFLCDDNLYGHPAFARDLLNGLIALNRTFPAPMRFTTQITVNVARNPEMLELLADANFDHLYIGVETPDAGALKEANKPQNKASELVGDIRRIHEHGIAVRAGMIVGFDHDDAGIFDTQFRFLHEAGVPIATVNMLKAPIGTKLWTRLLAERRILSDGSGLHEEIDSMRYSQTNVLPAQLSRRELMRGLLELMERLADWGNFARRVSVFISTVTRAPRIPAPPPDPKAQLSALEQLLGAFTGQPEVQKIVTGLLMRAQLTKPFLVSRIFSLVFQQVGIVGLVAQLRREIEEQIALEAAITDYTTLINRSPIPIPEPFRRDFPEIFPDLYDHLKAGLADGSRLPWAMGEVVKDFVIRWGASYTGLEPHHRVDLTEIADRLLASLPAGDGREAFPGEATDDPQAVATLRKEILKTVEIDLRRLTA